MLGAGKLPPTSSDLSALAQSFEQFGLALTERAARDYGEINKGLWLLFEKGEIEQKILKVERFRVLFLRLGEKIDAALFSEAYIEWLSRASFLLDGAEELCRYLSEKYILAIITNGIKKVQISRIGNSDIKGGIDYGIDTCWANLASRKNETSLVPTYEIRKLEELRTIL